MRVPHSDFNTIRSAFTLDSNRVRLLIVAVAETSEAVDSQSETNFLTLLREKRKP